MDILGEAMKNLLSNLQYLGMDYSENNLGVNVDNIIFL